jgi:MFS family permease
LEQNWTWIRKHLILLQCAFHAAGPGFTSAILIPALEPLAEQFEITPQKASYLVATHVLFLGLAPFLWNPLMNAFGRRAVLVGTMLLSCVAALGGGFANSYGTLMTARVFQSIGISSGLVVPGAVVVDIFTKEERGRKNGVWTQMVSLGAPVGGIIGGPVIYYVGWRWVMWLVAICNGLQFLAYLFTVPETSCTHRQLSGPGEDQFSNMFKPPKRSHGRLGLRSFFEPFLLLQSPHVTLVAFAYGVTFAITSPGISSIVPLATKEVYNFSPIAQGLFFVGPLVGVLLGELVAGPTSDWLMNRERSRATSNGRDVRLEARLLGGLPGYVLAPLGVVIFGVTLETHCPWIAPCIGFALANFGLQLVTTPLKTYCMDCYPSHSGSVLQLINAIRQIISFTVPFWSPNLSAKVGYGLGFGIEAIIMVFFSVCSLLAFWKGSTWRQAIEVKGLVETK